MVIPIPLGHVIRDKKSVKIPVIVIGKKSRNTLGALPVQLDDIHDGMAIWAPPPPYIFSGQIILLSRKEKKEERAVTIN